MPIDSQDSLKSDLASDKPLWPLSTFGPAKYEPNLISNLDESMEELRLKAVVALKAGTVNEYV
jgi:nucleoporin NUP42